MLRHRVQTVKKLRFDTLSPRQWTSHEIRDNSSVKWKIFRNECLSLLVTLFFTFSKKDRTLLFWRPELKVAKVVWNQHTVQAVKKLRFDSLSPREWASQEIHDNSSVKWTEIFRAIMSVIPCDAFSHSPRKTLLCSFATRKLRKWSAEPIEDAPKVSHFYFTLSQQHDYVRFSAVQCSFSDFISCP